MHMQQEQTRRSHRGGGSALHEQRSEDLPQHVHIQAIAGLGHLGEVREEELQGETVVKRDGGGALESEAHLPVVASGTSSGRTV